MNFDDNSNSAKPTEMHSSIFNEDSPDLIDEGTLIELRGSIEKTLEAMDKHGVKSYEPAVIVFSAKDLSLADGVDTASLGDSVTGFKFGLESKVYIGRDILPAENGVEMCQHAGMLAAQDNLKPVAAFLISEAWISENLRDENGELRRPKDDPERKEVVIVNGMTIGQKKTLLVYDITREEDDTAHLSLRKSFDGNEAKDMGPMPMFFVTYIKEFKERISSM